VQKRDRLGERRTVYADMNRGRVLEPDRHADAPPYLAGAEAVAQLVKGAGSL